MQYISITIIKPNKPVLVPSKVHKYAPARTTVIKVHILIPVLLFFPKFGRIINISNNIIVPILFPDSNHPL